MQIISFKNNFKIIISHKSDGNFRNNSIKVIKFIKEQIKNRNICHITLENGTKRYLCTSIPDKEAVADAVLTNRPDTVLSLVVADCLPIILADKKTKAFALVHAGWKGLVQNIIELTLQDMTINFKTEASDLDVWIGPSIKSCCYKSESDLLLQNYLVSWQQSIKKQKKGWTIDLVDFAKRELIRLGVAEKNIETDDHCTCCDHNFFSHQRSKNTKEPEGRFLVGVYRSERF